MDDKHWRLIIDELSSDIEIFEKSGDAYVNTVLGEWPVIQYYKFVIGLTSNFIGECRRDIQNLGLVPDSFSDMLFKINFIFKQRFNLNFPEGEINFPIKYGNVIITAENEDNNSMIFVVKSKIYAFEMAITFLRAQLKHTVLIERKQRIRSRAVVSDFRTILTAAQLSEILESGKKLSFFHDDVKRKEFIDIFSGRPAKNPINWIGSIYSLNRFIQGINGEKLNKITDGKWDIVSELFIVNDKKVTAKSLEGSSKSKNDRLDDLDRLLGNINDIDLF